LAGAHFDFSAGVIALRDLQARDITHRRDRGELRVLVVDRGLVAGARAGARDVRSTAAARGRVVQRPNFVCDVALFDGRARLVLPLRFDRRFLFFVVRERLRLWHNVGRYTLWPSRIWSPAHRLKLYGAQRYRSMTWP